MAVDTTVFAPPSVISSDSESLAEPKPNPPLPPASRLSKEATSGSQHRRGQRPTFAFCGLLALFLAAGSGAALSVLAVFFGLRVNGDIPSRILVFSASVAGLVYFVLHIVGARLRLTVRGQSGAALWLYGSGVHATALLVLRLGLVTWMAAIVLTSLLIVRIGVSFAASLAEQAIYLNFVISVIGFLATSTVALCVEGSVTPFKTSVISQASFLQGYGLNTPSEVVQKENHSRDSSEYQIDSGDMDASTTDITRTSSKRLLFSHKMTTQILGNESGEQQSENLDENETDRQQQQQQQQQQEQWTMPETGITESRAMPGQSASLSPIAEKSESPTTPHTTPFSMPPSWPRAAAQPSMPKHARMEETISSSSQMPEDYSVSLHNPVLKRTTPLSPSVTRPASLVPPVPRVPSIIEAPNVLATGSTKPVSASTAPSEAAASLMVSSQTSNKRNTSTANREIVKRKPVPTAPSPPHNKGQTLSEPKASVASFQDVSAVVNKSSIAASAAPDGNIQDGDWNKTEAAELNAETGQNPLLSLFGNEASSDGLSSRKSSLSSLVSSNSPPPSPSNPSKSPSLLPAKQQLVSEIMTALRDSTYITSFAPATRLVSFARPQVMVPEESRLSLVAATDRVSMGALEDGNLLQSASDAAETTENSTPQTAINNETLGGAARTLSQSQNPAGLSRTARRVRKAALMAKANSAKPGTRITSAWVASASSPRALLSPGTRRRPATSYNFSRPLVRGNAALGSAMVDHRSRKRRQILQMLPAQQQLNDQARLSVDGSGSGNGRRSQHRHKRSLSLDISAKSFKSRPAGLRFRRDDAEWEDADDDEISMSGNEDESSGHQHRQRHRSSRRHLGRRLSQQSPRSRPISPMTVLMGRGHR